MFRDLRLMPQPAIGDDIVAPQRSFKNIGRGGIEKTAVACPTLFPGGADNCRAQIALYARDAADHIQLGLQTSLLSFEAFCLFLLPVDLLARLRDRGLPAFDVTGFGDEQLRELFGIAGPRSHRRHSLGKRVTMRGAIPFSHAPTWCMIAAAQCRNSRRQSRDLLLPLASRALAPTGILELGASLVEPVSGFRQLVLRRLDGGLDARARLDQVAQDADDLGAKNKARGSAALVCPSLPRIPDNGQLRLAQLQAALGNVLIGRHIPSAKTGQLIDPPGEPQRSVVDKDRLQLGRYLLDLLLNPLRPRCEFDLVRL